MSWRSLKSNFLEKIPLLVKRYHATRHASATEVNDKILRIHPLSCYLWPRNAAVFENSWHDRNASVLNRQYSAIVQNLASSPEQRNLESQLKPFQEITSEENENTPKQETTTRNSSGKKGEFDSLTSIFEKGEVDSNGYIPVEQQKTLRVGIAGLPNAGKSVLTNALVGEKVTIVSRKTHTTRREILGVSTRGDTQLLIFDTPGLTQELRSQQIRQEYRKMVSRAWNAIKDAEVLIVLVDAERQIRKPDRRVKWLAETFGSEPNPEKPTVVCLNKVDLIRDKRTLLPLAEYFQSFPGFERIFMISGLTKNGLKSLEEYLTDKAVIRPWEEEPSTKSTLTEKEIALEAVRETILDRIHQELPYILELELESWKHLRDESERIEMSIIVQTNDQRAIYIGKNGETIRYNYKEKIRNCLQKSSSFDT